MHFELGTFFVQILAFLILLYLMRRYVFGPAMRVMERRQQYIEDQVATAERTRQEAEALLQEQKNLLAQARSEAQEIIERAKQHSEREAEAILKEARERAERMVEEARAEILREKEQALAELKQQVGALSVMLAAKIIEKELDEREQLALIEKTLQQVGDSA